MKSPELRSYVRLPDPCGYRLESGFGFGTTSDQGLATIDSGRSSRKALMYKTVMTGYETATPWLRRVGQVG
jgi:hypothetical protein